MILVVFSNVNDSMKDTARWLQSNGVEGSIVGGEKKNCFLHSEIGKKTSYYSSGRNTKGFATAWAVRM